MSTLDALVPRRINKYIQKNCLSDVNVATLLQDTDAFIFGGAVRDAIANKPINDIDIVCFSEAEAIMNKRLRVKGFTWAECGEFDELYHGISLFSAPILFTKGNCKIHLIRLNPANSLLGLDWQKGFSKAEGRIAQEKVVANVDIDICGVYYHPITGVVEAVEGAVNNALNHRFYSCDDGRMHHPTRAKERVLKLVNRGYEYFGSTQNAQKF